MKKVKVPRSSASVRVLTRCITYSCAALSGGLLAEAPNTLQSERLKTKHPDIKPERKTEQLKSENRRRKVSEVTEMRKGRKLQKCERAEGRKIREAENRNVTVKEKDHNDLLPS
jgi:hypothetical protein